MTKDGECRNKKCGGKKILNVSEAAKIIEEGGCVAHRDVKDNRYYSLSTMNDGSIGFYRTKNTPHSGWCYVNTQAFIKGLRNDTFIQVYPEAIQSKENHVEANEVVGLINKGDRK